MQERESSSGRGREGTGFEIKFTRGKDAGKTFALSGKRTTLGRKPENTVALSDIKVSGVHAEIVFEQGRPVIRDLGSTNGTFLEGKQITEVILSVGDRVILGESEFVLARKGQAAEAPPREPEAMEEVRVIHDVRGVRRGMGGLVLLLILLVGLGGAGYYYFFHVSPKSTYKKVEAQRGNLVADGWSFEGGRGGENIAELWTLKSDTDTTFTLARRDARSGQYTIRASMPEGGAARCAYAATIRLKSRRQYKASAWVKVSGNAMVGLKAAYFRSGQEGGQGEETRHYLYTDEFVSAREEGIDYRQIQGTVFPPSEAVEMELNIVAAGQGEILVDDVELFEESSSQPDLLGTSGGLDFFACGRGYAVRRIDNTLFLGGRLLAAEPDPQNGTRMYDSDTAAFSLGEEGCFYGGARAGLLRFTDTLKVDARQIRGHFTLAAAEAGPVTEFRYCFELLRDYARHGVGILSGEEFSLYGSTFPGVQADALILGGVHDRVKVVFERPVQVVGVERKDKGASLQCVFPSGQEINFQYTIQSDFTEEIRLAQSMIQQAAKAEREERYGDALELIDQIMQRFPYNGSVMDHAAEIRGAILEKKRAWLARIQEQLKSAQFLNTPELFTSLEETCQRALDQFPGDKDLQGSLEEVKAEGSALLDRLRDERAEVYYHIARNLYDAGGREQTLAEVLLYMEQRFPESEWTRKANIVAQGGQPAEEGGPETGEGDDAGGGGGNEAEGGAADDAGNGAADDAGNGGEEGGGDGG